MTNDQAGEVIVLHSGRGAPRGAGPAGWGRAGPPVGGPRGSGEQRRQHGHHVGHAGWQQAADREQQPGDCKRSDDRQGRQQVDHCLSGRSFSGSKTPRRLCN